MDKKKLHFNAVSCSLDGRTWTTPVYHKGKENYVGFYAYDPAIGRLHRKKMMLDRIKSTRARNSYAHSLVEELTQRLMRGWNPWVESRAGTQFLTWEEVCDLYRKYVIKLHSDGAFREETMRDYLSRLKVLSEWEGMRIYKVYYAYQIDGTVLSKFMDYILMERNNSVQTYNNYVAWLRTFFAWLMARRHVHDDPTVGLQTIRRPKNKNRTVIPEKVLVELRRYLEERNRHYLLACYILHYMFVRPAEMAMLRLQDFQIARKTLLLHGGQTKNRQDAVVTLPDHIVRLMLDLGVFSYPGHYFLFSDKFMPGEEWKDSKQFRDYWNYHLRRDLKLKPEYKFYSLKDTGITNMLRANTDPISVRDQARHSSLLITNTYTPLDIKEANPLILSYQGVF